MSLEKVGKTLVGLLAATALAVGFYATLGEDDSLEARLTYAHLTYPGQFNERISQANELLKYERLQARINDIGAGALGHGQVERLVDLAQAPYVQLFAKPFEAGLVDHRTGLLIELTNHRQVPARQVTIRLPARGLVQVRDDAGNDRLLQRPTRSVEIPSLKPAGTSKVWVYFDADYAQIRQGGIEIRDADGAADTQVYREVVGLPAWAARYSRELLGVLLVLVVAVLILGRQALSRRPAQVRA